MSYEYYFGAYLEVKTNLIKLAFDKLVCVGDNSHRILIEADFCHHCGSWIAEKQIEISRYPTMVVDHLLDDEKWADILIEMTTDEFRGLETMLLKPNMRDGGEWIHIVHGYTEGSGILKFPSNRQVTRLKNEFTYAHADIIAALAESDRVVGLEVKAGFVEYSL